MAAQLEERVRERSKELLHSNEELQQLAYLASHDLQEPLRTASVYAQPIGARICAYLQRMVQAGRAASVGEAVDQAVKVARKLLEKSSGSA